MVQGPNSRPIFGGPSFPWTWRPEGTQVIGVGDLTPFT